MQGAGVQSLVRELSGMDKRKQTEKQKKKNQLLGCVDLQMFQDLSGLQLPSIYDGGVISVQGS